METQSATATVLSPAQKAWATRRAKQAAADAAQRATWQRWSEAQDALTAEDQTILRAALEHLSENFSAEMEAAYERLEAEAKATVVFLVEKYGKDAVLGTWMFEATGDLHGCDYHTSIKTLVHKVAAK